jgi:hypothetical protein
VLLPATRIEQPVDGVEQRLRIFPARPAATARTGWGVLGGITGPFGIIGFTRPQRPAEARGQLAPGPRVRLGLRQRLGGPAHAVRTTTGRTTTGRTTTGRTTTGRTGTGRTGTGRPLARWLSWHG